MTSTANSQPLLIAELTEQTQGAWVARVEVDADEALAAAVTLDVEGVEFVGTVMNGAMESARYKANVIGGAGGLSTLVDARWYDHGPRLRNIINDLMGSSGETLSTTSSATVLNTVVPRYGRRSGTVGQALTDVCGKVPGTVWRVLRDGTVYIGPVEYVAADINTTAVEEWRDNAHGRIGIAPEAPEVAPGAALTYGNVSKVTTSLTGGKLRQTLTVDGFATGGNQLDSAVAGMVDRKIDYLRQYSAEIRGQSGNRVDVLPDDARIAGIGITSALLRHGLPGLTVTLTVGERCLLGFENGDPSAPYVALWPDGSSVESVQLTTASGTTIDGGPVTVGNGSSPVVNDTFMQVYLTAVIAAVGALGKVPTKPITGAEMASLEAALNLIPMSFASSNLTAD